MVCGSHRCHREGLGGSVRPKGATERDWGRVCESQRGHGEGWGGQSVSHRDRGEEWQGGSVPDDGHGEGCGGHPLGLTATRDSGGGPLCTMETPEPHGGVGESVADPCAPQGWEDLVRDS